MKNYKNAFCSEFKIEMASMHPYVLKLFPHVKKVLWGGVYDDTGNLISNSVRRGIYGGDHVASIALDYANLSRKKTVIKGKSLYLGPLMGHYGHFLIETLSRIDLFDLNEFDYIIFSKFIFGNNINNFHKDFLKYFGVNSKKIIVVENETMFEELYVSRQLWNINRKPDIYAKNVYSYINKCIKESKSKEKVLLTYANRNDSRIKNLLDVEDIFKKHGFIIVVPEKLTIIQQLEIYKNSTILAGVSGTAMHNCLFSNLGGFCIEIGDERASNDYMPIQKEIIKMNNLHSFRINFIGKNGVTNLNELEKSLCKILNSIEEYSK